MMATTIAQADFAQWHAWVNEAALAAFAVFVCFVVYKLAIAGGKRVVELGERYVTSTESLHDTLRVSEEERTKLCERHAVGLQVMAVALEKGNESTKNGTALLATLVALHEDPGGNVHDAIGIIHENNADLQRMKRAANRACEMCRTIAKSEFPNSANKVSEHCDEIERIIGEA